MARLLKPLAERTRAEYAAILRLAYPKSGDPAGRPHLTAIEKWTEGRRVVLRAAVKRTLEERGSTPGMIETAIKAIPRADYREPPPAPHVPAESEAKEYEARARALPPPQRALALLPLTLGLRAREVLTLPRESVQRARETGVLRFIRKGGKEWELPADHAFDLFDEVLAAPRLADTLIGNPIRKARPWKLLGEVLSEGGFSAQYRALWRIVRSTGGAAGLNGLRPHLLRHAFATRLVRDGAPMRVAQYALGHASMRTTERYVHADHEDLRKYVRRG